MAKIIIHQDMVSDAAALAAVCPFGAIEIRDGKVEINAGCRMCRLCCKKYSTVFEFSGDDSAGVDKSQWRGVAVVAELVGDGVHPVTLELLGKAKELAAKSSQPVYALIMGYNISRAVEEVSAYGDDELFVYDCEELEHFRIEPGCAVLEDFINRVKPSTILVGGTPVGRSLAPRAAARFRTGLTADCTVLDMQSNTDLDQIRPAYGGNIMAHIRTPNHRPQFATVRYKIFPMPEKSGTFSKITRCTLAPEKLASSIKFISMHRKHSERGIEDAEVIVVAGRGVKRQEDVEMIRELAGLLGGEVGSTRAMVEAGVLEARRQIGLSGRTVKPKLIITCGVSGAVQFAAGMNGSELIIAINTDPDAPIFNIAHIGIVGDLYEIVPSLIERIKSGKGLL